MAFKLRSGNKAPFKKIGSTEETNAQYNARVRAEYEAELQARSDSSASYRNALEINELQLDNADLWNARNARKNILGFQTEEFEFSEKERKEYSKQRREVLRKQMKLAQENRKRGIFSRFDSEEGFENTSYDTGGHGTNERVESREAGRLYAEGVIGDRYERLLAEQEEKEKFFSTTDNAKQAETLKPSDKPIEKPIYRNAEEKIQEVQKEKRRKEKLIIMESKNLQLLPVNESEPNIQKALPQELSGSDYFTITSKYHHPGNKNIIKDSAGREVDRVTDEEYKEKYGNILQRGTKQYGQKDLKRRLYVKK
tara:strand:- start:604 stop:1536 length:933 start_codon:yes stop_codon:yes gene_type:complete